MLDLARLAWLGFMAGFILGPHPAHGEPIPPGAIKGYDYKVLCRDISVIGPTGQINRDQYAACMAGEEDGFWSMTLWMRAYGPPVPAVMAVCDPLVERSRARGHAFAMASDCLYRMTDIQRRDKYAPPPQGSQGIPLTEQLRR